MTGDVPCGKKKKAKRGFALVATLTLLVLLAVIALGLLSLSTISLRSSSRSHAMGVAQANARLALQIAIGELQKHTGSDTRVTAPSSIVDPASPPIVGVWKSWEGLNHDPTGRPIQPDYGVKGLADGDGNGRFLTWLISGAREGEEIATPSALAFSEAAADGSTVALVSSGTLGANPGQIHVTPELVNAETGAIAWWVSAENQKARLPQPYSPRTDDAAGWADLAKSHATPDPSPFGLDPLLDDPEAYQPDPIGTKPGRKAVSLQTTGFLVENNPSDPQFGFHDLSTSAVGLLTNTATGGWRKDLSILTEKWDDIHAKYPGGKLPLFRYLPEAGKTSGVPKVSTADYRPAQSSFYPWSDYAQFGSNGMPMTVNAASASWQSLVKFATGYKTITYDSGTGIARAPIGWKPIVADLGRNPSTGTTNGTQISNADYFSHYHDLNLNPVLARSQFIIQANALPHPNPDGTIADPSKQHRINLRVVPYFTFWNPYNVEIVKSGGLEYGIQSMRTLPIALSIINGTVAPTGGFDAHYKLLNGGRDQCFDGTIGKVDTQISGNPSGVHYGGSADFVTWLPKNFTLKPGEVKIFAPQTDGFSPFGVDYQFNLLLKEGYVGAPDFGIPLMDPSKVAGSPTPNDHINRLVKVPGRPNDELHSGDAVRFAVSADRLTKLFRDASLNFGAGAAFTIGTFRLGTGRTRYENGETNRAVDRVHAAQAMFVDRDWAQKYWSKDDLEVVEYSVSALTPGGGNPPWTNIMSMSFGPRISFGSSPGDPQGRPTKGLLQSSPFANNAFSIPVKSPPNHPVNGAYDISYHSMSLNSDLSPEIGPEGYISTGFQSGDGLSRLIMAEIPLRPMASLAELQSWNLRGNNPYPPHQFNLIGNSDATPLIRRDSVLAGSPISITPATNLQHDDAYCANHLLFDDWFLSTIATQPATFGASTPKDIETVYRDYLQGTSRLTNRAYLPIAEDRDLSSTDASARVSEIISPALGDGWLKVASRFEVEGMFNVNSTSVKAWRALLGHARRQQVALQGETGIELDAAEHEHVVSRHTVAGDIKAGDDPGLGAAFPSGSEYVGFRTLGDDQLDELANKIVDQVRLRGPFLSLSEFINRQLVSDDNLALAGALQAALNSIADDPNKALSDPGNGLSSATMAADDDKLNGNEYAFVKASEGMSTHGFPGWIRQADVLRPIAPVLSARDDSFTIRAYGDARDSAGNVSAQAWCEATVRRTRDFVDPQDAADSITPPVSPANREFGRRYVVTSFRWLNKDEI